MKLPPILVDTSLLIDFFRKKIKTKSELFRLKQQYSISISVISLYEFKIGANAENLKEYQAILSDIAILPLTEPCIEEAITIYNTLKRRNERIGLADTLIAATASANALPIATLNKEHFSRIESLSCLDIAQSS